MREHGENARPSWAVQADKEGKYPPPIEVHAHTHSSAPSSAAIITIQLNCEFGDGTFLIATYGPDYVVLGSVGDHPMIQATDFSYSNSDGSGPTLLITQDWFDSGNADGPVTDLESPKAILDVIAKYFTVFCDDGAH